MNSDFITSALWSITSTVGGYSPNPIAFLTAASQRSRRIRLITGAVLPAFNHPLKLAGEIGMLDAISKGRLEVGFARAFLPHEFARFGVALDESRARFETELSKLWMAKVPNHRHGPAFAECGIVEVWFCVMRRNPACIPLLLEERWPQHQ